MRILETIFAEGMAAESDRIYLFQHTNWTLEPFLEMCHFLPAF